MTSSSPHSGRAALVGCAKAWAIQSGLGLGLGFGLGLVGGVCKGLGIRDGADDDHTGQAPELALAIRQAIV